MSAASASTHIAAWLWMVFAVYLLILGIEWLRSKR